MKKRKVILVDKASFLREAFKSILLSIGNVEIIAEASTGCEFIRLLDTHQPDIVFIDIKVEEINGIKATELALKKNKDLAIIGFSSVDKQCYVSQMMEAGAKGFLSKSKNNYDILSQIIKNPKKGNFFSVDLEMDTKIAS
ncbi:MAG: response regulator transcription factor [Chloroflexia bacterium]|nr:response regulator transcription factor [Chloroflexia bacterium]